MCGRLFCEFESKKDLIEYIKNDLNITGINFKEFEYEKPKFNIAPTAYLPVIKNKLAFESLQWGFKIGNHSKLIINSRNETADKLRSFKNLVNTERCVVLSSGYYEWKTSGKKKFPYAFRPESSQICYIAGLRDPITNSVVLMTREAVPNLAKIHSRMPVILRPNHVMKWLDSTNYTYDYLRQLLITDENYTGNRNDSKDYLRIQFEAVCNLVNNSKFDDPKCLQPLSVSQNESFDKGIGKYFKKVPKTEK